MVIQEEGEEPLEGNQLPADPGRTGRQRGLCLEYILDNIKPNGAIVASTSKDVPNYYYFWPRDGCVAVTVLDMVKEYKKAERCCEFLRQTQDKCGSWRQRYNIDGTVARGNWADPQHDQTALAVITLVEHFTKTMDFHYLQDFWPTIMRACDFLYYDRQPTWDLWEESFGYHYNTLSGIIRAMTDGSRAALAIGDYGDYKRYMKEAQRLSDAINHYFTPDGYIKSEHKRIHGLVPFKSGLLDTSIIKAHVHYDGLYLNYPIVENTVKKIETAFGTYPINKENSGMGMGIGRYPEDRYDGIGHTGGNPWYITTLWLAQYYYLKGDITRGNEYLDWVLEHIPRNGRMSEQIDKVSGEPRGAENLTWSYAEFIRTEHIKEKALRHSH